MQRQLSDLHLLNVVEGRRSYCLTNNAENVQTRKTIGKANSDRSVGR